MRSFRSFLLLISLFLTLSCGAAFGGDDWLPVPPEDLAMKDFAPMPGLHALILYHSVDRNDLQGTEQQYYRIKILDEEGKKYANVETEPYPSRIKVRDIKARAIKPDGSIVTFNGKVFDKIVKLKSFNYVSKTFSIPDVQVGSIIEYRYELSWDSNYLLDSQWMVQDRLVTREGVFKLKPYLDYGYGISWMTFFMRPNEQPKDEKSEIRLTVHNIPAFEKEEYMPPEAEVRGRVEFYYSRERLAKTADEYWKKESADWTGIAEEFMNKKKAAEREVAVLVTASDDPEQKLRKLYDRVQKLRNLTYERSKSEKEEKKENLKDNIHIEDVLKHGYGYHNQLVRTFTALARAAGLPATLVRVQERDGGFFHKELRRFEKLDTELAVVTVNGKELYLDPGVPFCPFGLLSWEDTGVQGLALSKDAPKWIKTPQPAAENSTMRRVADLILDRDGTLSGEVQVRFEGNDALRRRLMARNDDDAERKKDLEEELKHWLPSNATIELAKIDDWSKTGNTFDLAMKVTVPGFAAATGKRMMVPVTLFAGSDAHPFTHAKRIHPVYFRMPWREVDQIKIKLPEGMQVETLPQAKELPTAFAEFKMNANSKDGTLDIARELSMNGVLFQTEHYPALRSFLDKVKAVGDEQAILRVTSK